jgi:hypothetical protein
MKKMNKVIAAMMIMAITAIPAMAATSVDKNADKNARPDRKEMRMMDRRYDRHMGRHHFHHAPVIEMTTFKVSPRAARHKNVVIAAKSIHGVKDVRWNPRNGMMTVVYDARRTTAHHIRAIVN